MTVNKRTKASRYRGSHTHGCGSMKKRRGAGNRGGRGMAGTGKRGDQNKPSIWDNKKYFGKFGFKKKNTGVPIKAVNLNYFEKKVDNLVAKKLIEKQGDVYVIDTQKIGFNKVLGCGKLTKKLNITCKSFSKQAVEKITKAGGQITEIKKKKIITPLTIKGVRQDKKAEIKIDKKVEEPKPEKPKGEK
jgi:large subunit ribosomal protein L15